MRKNSGSWLSHFIGLTFLFLHIGAVIAGWQTGGLIAAIASFSLIGLFIYGSLPEPHLAHMDKHLFCFLYWLLLRASCFIDFLTKKTPNRVARGF
jgi:hypothetical protein